MGLHRCRWPLLAAWACISFSTTGCGSRGGLGGSNDVRCQPDTAACLSPLVGQICNQQGQWATFQCPNGQVCEDKTCVAADEACSPGATQCLTGEVSQICDASGQWTTFRCAADQICRDQACTAAESPCSVGATRCLTAQVSQVCDQRGQWNTFACASNQVCRDKVCATTEKPCSSGATQCLTSQVVQNCDANGQWVTSPCKAGQICTDGRCQGVCSPNTRECVGDHLQRICLGDGSSWVASDCPDGFKCNSGECVGICKPGSKQCAATRITRECRSDGSGYVEQECPVGMACNQGICIPDVTATCVPGQDFSCRDADTAMRCKADGSGYDVTPCHSGTECHWGYCQGSMCSAGETSCTMLDVANLIGVQTCTDDGTGYTVSMCRAHEQCVRNQQTNRDECYLPPCKKGETACGDPTAKQSSADSLSRCQELANGKLGWVSYRCSAPASCTVDDQGLAHCYADCAPGDRRCADDDNAIESCGEDGKWTKQSCDTLGGGIQACLVVPTNEKVVCGDPECNQLQYDLYTYRTRGRCSAEKIRLCGDDGRLAKAVTCDGGMCLPDDDGYGVCKDPSRCDHADGWRECVTDNDAFRTCNSHHWDFTLCAAAQACSDDGQGHAACGDQCTPESRRCSGSGYQTCLANGTWGSTKACDTGECNPITTRCEIACQPGEIRCVGDVSLATDGSSLGTAAMQTCKADGSWGTTQVCGTAAGKVQYCRRSGHGVHLGCLECVGDKVPGGNEENAVDSRCSADANGLQICTENNTWPTAVTACDASEQCVKRRDGTIRGSCSDDGCSNNSSRRCVGFLTLATPVTINDCCAGDCQSATGECLHRSEQYDPTCLDSSSCFTGRYDSGGGAIYETCCNGFCKAGEGCLRIKGQPCATVTSCEVSRLGQTTVCCGNCQADGSCAKGQDAQHPIGEYFMCGSSSPLCWNISSCTWTPGSGVSGAMYADCKAKTGG